MFTLTHLHVNLHLEINTSQLAGGWRAEQATAKVSCSKTFFLVNSVYTNNVLNARVHVETLVILQSKFHVVLRLLSVLQTAISMLS